MDEAFKKKLPSPDGISIFIPSVVSISTTNKKRKSKNTWKIYTFLNIKHSWNDQTLC